ncbi:MAG: FtsK/SpoIIIE domain-containing protein, partial [Planctomycetota bacterium]|nr:FtsK/SpoIIIE domain-containing protein [Planctomycetota bacterium]
FEQEALRRHAEIVERRDRSLIKFTADRDAALADCAARRETQLAVVTQSRDNALRVASEKHNVALLALEAAARRDLTAIRLQHDRARSEKTAQFERERELAARGTSEIGQRCAQAWGEVTNSLVATTERHLQESRSNFPAWSEIADPQWLPPESPPTQGLRLGDYTVNFADWPGAMPADRQLPVPSESLRWPAVWSFPGAPALLLKAEGAGVAASIQVLQSTMLRLMAHLPPGAVRFTIFDPVGLGENFAAFMNLADFDDLLITSRIWTESSQIDTQLAKLTEHMETVFQKYLRNEFESIEDYNRQAGEVAEPYRVLVIAGFPAGFSEKSAQRLISIATKGARCGVATLIAFDTRLPRPHGFDPQSLEEVATVLEWSDGNFVNKRLGAEPVVIVPDGPPAAPQLVSLVRKFGELSKDVRRVEVPFQRIVPRREQYWKEDSRSLVRVPLGRAGATRLQYLQLGKGTSQHVLIAGKTGSGKSTLLNVIITDLALRYSPDEVEFYLIDFKKGVEFKTYATHQLPHARAIAIESDREFGVSVLERLDTVLRERGDLFRSQGVQDIAAFRQAVPDRPMPRVLLIVDEFQEFFVEDDRYSQQAALLLDRLVRQGRAFGIHILLGSQTLGGSYSLPRTTVGQMAVRIALQCSEADAHLILSEDNTAARLLTRPGEAIYNDANGLVEGNSPFQVAWLDDAQRDDFLQRVADLAVARGRPAPDQIVFEGNIPADPLRNSAWRGVIEATTADLASSQADLGRLRSPAPRPSRSVGDRERICCWWGRIRKWHWEFWRTVW